MNVQKSKRIRRQVSQNTEVSSTTSLESGSDDEDCSNEFGTSSHGDESLESDDSQDGDTLIKTKCKNKSGTFKRYKNLKLIYQSKIL